MTIKEFIKNHDIKLQKVIKVSQNPNMVDKTWQANHYEVTLATDKPFICYYSKGLGLKGKPTAEEVLNSLAFDIMDISSTTFEDWCDAFGYDSDSIQALTIYNNCKAEYKGLVDWLGYSAIDELMDCEQL